MENKYKLEMYIESEEDFLDWTKEKELIIASRKMELIKD